MEASRSMPTVLRIGPYRFYFWSHELNEPPHIHVDRDEQSAKYWLQPISLAKSIGFKKHELRRIETIVREHERELLEAWHVHFRTGGR
jgi:hypothetical protein